MRILNTTADISSAFENGHFCIEKWEQYMDKWIPGAKEKCIADMQRCLSDGYLWETDFLPVLDFVQNNPSKCKEVTNAFLYVTDHLDEKIEKVFGKTVDADIVLYLGLCNGAGWVTEIEGKSTILLGVEKILELGWQGIDDMTGLIIHECGHLYHKQYGSSKTEVKSPEDPLLWQLFSEGVAMVFEQEVIGDEEYFHQDKNGWKSWCDKHAEHIKQSFCCDLKTMTPETQRYFGDWVNFEGYADTGYYLGAQFVRYMLRQDSFDGIIQYDLDTVKEKFGEMLL